MCTRNQNQILLVVLCRMPPPPLRPSQHWYLLRNKTEIFSTFSTKTKYYSDITCKIKICIYRVYFKFRSCMKGVVPWVNLGLKSQGAEVTGFQNRWRYFLSLRLFNVRLIKLRQMICLIKGNNFAIYIQKNISQWWRFVVALSLKIYCTALAKLQWIVLQATEYDA